MTSQNPAETGWYSFAGTIPIEAWLDAMSLTSSGNLVIDFGKGPQRAWIESPTSLTNPGSAPITVRGRYAAPEVADE